MAASEPPDHQPQGKMEDDIRKRTIQITGFKDTEKKALIEMILKLDCTFDASKIYRNCTHLIAKQPSKSEKFLAACAAGKWVLTKDYIINSAKSGRWLDETTYEWGYKIKKDSHYSPQIQSAPKRWREELIRTGAPGAFHRWKVVVLVKKYGQQNSAYARVLKAGKATICVPKNSADEVTHVLFCNDKLSEKERSIFKAPCYPIRYMGDYLFEKEIQNNDEAMQVNSLLNEYQPDTGIDRQLTQIKDALKRHICEAQAVRCNFGADKITEPHREVKNVEFSRGELNIIENLIDGQFFSEAIEELVSLPSHFVPPVCLLRSLIRNMLQNNVDTSYVRYFHVLSTLLHLHPPWKSTSMLRYYLEFFQCPVCMEGTWSLIEALVRSCLFNEVFCHSVPESVIEAKVLRKILLKFLFHLVKGEVQALSKKLGEQADSWNLKVKPQSILLETFWFGNETSVLLTKPISKLLDWVVRSHKENYRKNDVFKLEVSYLLTGILGAAVDYWIFLGLRMDRNVVRHVTQDLGDYVALSCDEFSSQELETFICSLPSSWLQMCVAEAVFKKACVPKDVIISPEPISLQKMVCSYLPVIGRAGMEASAKRPKQEKKIGRGPVPESQRALVMLNGAKQNQAGILLDPLELNHGKYSVPLKRLKRKSEGELSHSKDNQPSFAAKMHFKKSNLKGETALHRACINNKVEQLILLLSLPGTDINVKDYAGWTPLHEACNHGSTVCVREILQRCPEVDLLTQVDGVTPLHDALSNGHVEIGKLLLQHGGLVLLQQRDQKGKWPLDCVRSPQVKEELFAIVQTEDTIEDFTAKMENQIHLQQTEFGSFLLWSMKQQ
ncbi:SMC5-SMC6 complex localization factor protein 1 isoform X2 [Tachyglossus aculeatus]|uniref:SMC5-SMC6 complex localization factor protein 1 isoform X2 n=1 Tax=Tachyglossus aculeatus TaxID=9261 RepID=UPI0018F5077A|nr:SMC5-SMC6 complex localization factor protein 1 isoform X2 [Tachyglossus aculeatus]